MSTRRAVYEGPGSDLATIRLKAKNMSALRIRQFSGPRICHRKGIILRSF